MYIAKSKRQIGKATCYMIPTCNYILLTAKL